MKGKARKAWMDNSSLTTGFNIARLKAARDHDEMEKKLTPEQKDFIRRFDITQKAMSFDPEQQRQAVEEATSRGYEEGYKNGTLNTIKMMTAAYALATNELFGMGAERNARLAKRAAGMLFETVTTMELAQ